VETVGDACRMVLGDQLYALPSEYPRSLYRTGADGECHERPVFMQELFSDGVKKWLADRKGRTFAELQLEALSWVLAEEERIGGKTAKDEEEFLAPLRARRAELQKQVDTAREK
jgi:hypothetical protein